MPINVANHYLKHPTMDTATQLNTNQSPINGTDDREACSKFWIAVYTRPNCERKVAQHLSKEAIETFIPTQIVVKQWSDRKKKVNALVIPMIVFVRVIKSINNIRSLRSFSPLIHRPIYNSGSNTPAIIPDEQIERLKFMLDNASSPITFDSQTIKVGNSVRVSRGPLMGLVGNVTRVNKAQVRFLIVMESLGTIGVDIDPNDLEVLD